VACALNLSVKTAETHRSNIMAKLNLHSISEVVLYAVRNKIVQAFNSEDPSFTELNLAQPEFSESALRSTAVID